MSHPILSKGCSNLGRCLYGYLVRTGAVAIHAEKAHGQFPDPTLSNQGPEMIDGKGYIHVRPD
jgi:hypothetical protein